MAFLSRTPDATMPPVWRDIEPELVPVSVLTAHNAVVLDPATAVRLPGQGRLRPTVYIADSLILPVEVALSAELAKLFRDAGAQIGVTLPDLHPQRLERDREQMASRLDAIAVQLEPAVLPNGQLPTQAPNAWSLLQRVRAAASGQALEALAGVGLDHLLVGCGHVEGHPVTGMGHVEGHPYGIDEYAYAGSGGRAPVSWVGADPDYDLAFTGRRPVVAVLDTGIGKHRWFQNGVQTQLQFDGVLAALTDPDTDPEVTGDIVGPMDGALDSHSGHGTFIAGLIRQICPRADILALRVMGSDGIVEEKDLIRAMGVIAKTVDTGDDGRPPIDIVSLSLGYYHEDLESIALDSVLLKQIRALGTSGVAVVACAGNDGTSREMYPGAFYPHTGGVVADFERNCVPVLSVGALNPDRSVALFSNGGDWVGAWEIGAAVVSTFPQTFNGGAQPSVSVTEPPDAGGTPGATRASMDPDSFVEGFGTWSGTSFATPILAANLAKHLLQADQQAKVDDTPDPVRRMWDAVNSELGLERPQA
jgi:subtilisin family serine protease